MALSQSIRALERAEQQYEGWRPFAHLGRGQCAALRGNPEEAVAEYRRGLELAEPGEHAAWSTTTVALVEALLTLGQAEEARETARAGVAQCRRVALGPYAEHGIKRVLSLAEAATGRAEEGLARLERLRAAAEEGGTDGAPMGLLYETVARACIYAGDQAGFREAADLAGEKYRAGGNPALFAKHERLLEAGRAVGFREDSLRPGPRHGVDMSLEPTGVQTELAAAGDADERHQVALRAMLERTGAKSGFLFLWEETALRLCAAHEGTEPSKGLVASLTDYLKAELDDFPEVTVTCFDQQLIDGKDPGFAHPDGDYRPVLLSCGAGAQRKVVGIAALLDAGDGFQLPSLDVTSSVAEGLQWTAEEEDAVSIFELG